MPSEHDGKKAFTVKLSLSAEPRGLSYKTVRDSLLEVSCATESCGTVTKALRVTDGSDREWNVTVEPSQAYAITLTLPRARVQRDGRGVHRRAAARGTGVGDDPGHTAYRDPHRPGRARRERELRGGGSRSAWNRT